MPLAPPCGHLKIFMWRILIVGIYIRHYGHTQIRIRKFGEFSKEMKDCIHVIRTISGHSCDMSHMAANILPKRKKKHTNLLVSPCRNEEEYE